MLGTHLSIRTNIIDKVGTDWQKDQAKMSLEQIKMGFAYLQQRLESYSPWAKSIHHSHIHLHYKARIELAAKEILWHPKPKIFTTCPVWKKSGDPNLEGAEVRWPSQNTEQRDR